MSKHTPGPWKAELNQEVDYSQRHGEPTEVDTSDYVTVYDKSGNMIADFPVYSDTVDEITANAKLIAAAPEMLDALRDACSWITCWAENHPAFNNEATLGVIRNIEGVVLKAEGRSMDHEGNTSELQPWPNEWPKFYNSNEPCDMLVGPCSCGAWHNEGEFSLQDGEVVRLTGLET